MWTLNISCLIFPLLPVNAKLQGCIVMGSFIAQRKQHRDVVILQTSSNNSYFVWFVWNELNQRPSPWLSLWLLFIGVSLRRTRTVSKVELSQLAVTSAASPAAHHWPDCNYRRLQKRQKEEARRKRGFFSPCVCVFVCAWLHLCCERGCATRMR